MRAVKSKIGNVFGIPIADNRFCLGQIVADADPAHYMVAFDALIDSNNSFETKLIQDAQTLFVGAFFDSLIRRGDWKVLGHAEPDLTRIPFPCFKIRIGEHEYVESWDRSRRRLAEPSETQFLDRRNTNGPAFLRDAVLAHFGKRPYEAKFDRFRPAHVTARANLV